MKIDVLDEEEIESILANLGKEPDDPKAAVDEFTEASRNRGQFTGVSEGEMETRNSKMLQDFTEFCQQNPDLRFWQALRAWSGYRFICASNDQLIGESPNLKDTFSWEGKDR